MSQSTDRAEIADLVARLARLLDERRFDDLRTVYAEHVEAVSPRGDLRGIDQIIDVLRRTSPEGEQTQHVNGTVVVDVDGDRAEVSSSQLVYFFHAGGAPHRTAGVQATYTAVRAAEGWRFTRARITPLWQHAS